MPETKCSNPAFERILAEFRSRWEAGEHPRAEEYLGRLDHDHGVELAYHEFCLAELAGADPNPADYLERFPLYAERLNRLIGLHGAFGSVQVRELAGLERGDLPEEGDEIGPYRLIRLLGSGGFARVFLAEQTDLSDRLVVLKVATKASPEPRLLARARHPYIVEVLRHGSADDGSLHLVCMPFLGGATMSSVFEEARLGSRMRHGRSGGGLVRLLARVAAPEFPSDESPRPARDLLLKSSWTSAWCWIIARLAEALDHAFRRGVTHGDIKPSNILLAADASPMLFDFNLALDWRPDGSLESSVHCGGTLAYMAPEQLEAIASPEVVRMPLSAERHRADIYGLGLVLLEALTGKAPVLPIEKLPARRLARILADARTRGRPFANLKAGSIPAPVRAILRRCLAADPMDRYARARELAEDLDRYRAGLKLAHADEPRGWSLVFRRGRRHGWLFTAVGLALLAGVGVTTLFVVSSQRARREHASALADSYWDHADPDVFRFRAIGRWEEDSRTSPAETALRHLSRFRVLSSGDWRQEADVQALPESQREDLEAWICEQAWRYARDLFTRSNDRADWERARSCLRRVYALSPATPLRTLADRIASRLELVDSTLSPATSTVPRWIELYLRGVDAENRSHSEALAYFESALAKKPGSFWAQYRAAVACHQLGDYTKASQYLTRCIALQPQNAALRTQLAGCYFEEGKLDDAVRECDAALRINPDFHEAYRTRAYIRHELGQSDGQAKDVQRYESITRNEGMIPTWKLRIDSVSRGDNDTPTDETIEILRRLVLVDPDDVSAHVNLSSGLFKRGRTEEALHETDLALGLDPDHLHARYGRAMLLLKLDRRADATAEFSILINHPRFEERLKEDFKMLSAHSLLVSEYLGAKNTEKAIEVAKLGLRRAESLKSKRSGTRTAWTQSLLGNAHYALARAYTVAAEEKPAYTELAARELAEALKINPKFMDQCFEKDELLSKKQRSNVLAIFEKSSTKPIANGGASTSPR